jgi:hypothetical protein
MVFIFLSIESSYNSIKVVLCSRKIFIAEWKKAKEKCLSLQPQKKQRILEKESKFLPCWNKKTEDENR